MNGDVIEGGNHYVNLYLNRNHWNLDDHWRNLPCCYAPHDLCDCWVFYNNTFFVVGIIGIIRAVHEKRYDRSFIVGENLWHVTFF